ncbi:MAG TPA: cytochrome c peroxidase [Gemmatimonadaceae bacterium]|nr:cytochrome c peroxidase [Gemmatimonadaceae bacterium]
MRFVLRPAALLVGILALVVPSAAAVYGFSAGERWSAEERAMLRSLSLASLGPLPVDPSNRYADDTVAARLGHRLFFDRRLSSTGTVSCASCHLPDREFQDGRPLGKGVGTAARRTMPVAGTAHSPWQFWDGRTDSQWAQALGPLESPVEHGGDRTQYARLVAREYREMYEAVFGRLPDLAGLPVHAGPVPDTASAAAWRRMPAARQEDITRVYANIGKAIAAYERRIGFAPSRFDRYVEAELAGRAHTTGSAFSRDEEAGLRLFIGKGSCANCHNGALLTDNSFHNTGVPLPRVTLPTDSGRAVGVRQAVAGEFNCMSRYSDARPEDCQELRFAVTEGEALVRAYKTPSLRNVAGRAPYMHAGQLASLAEVVTHYNRATAAPFGHSELEPLRLSAMQQRQLEAFLRTLTGPLAAPPAHLESPPARRRAPAHLACRRRPYAFHGGSRHAIRRPPPR